METAIIIAAVILAATALVYLQRRGMEREMRVRLEEITRLASEALDRQGERLREQSNTQLNSVLSPLKEKLDEFSRSVTDAYVKDNATRRSLSDQIDRLMQLNLTIGEEARNLTSVLKGDTRVQGDWGETVLETLLESAGMVKNVNFFTQVTRDAGGSALRDEAGRGQRPDVVVLLPDNHRIVVDSKVSLTAYMDYCGAADERGRKTAGARHVRSVRNHIDELASRNYQDRYSDAVAHVLMFMPNEGAYFAAMQLDPALWKYAYDRRVVIVSPTHIFSVMQIVSQLWRQENQSRNVAKIADLGGLIFDKVASLVKELENVDARLEEAHKACGRAYDHLTKGGTSIARRAERMRELGARTRSRMSARALAEMESGEDDPE
ncbi:MAG: DNA recombination protein RmuC [Muribaculaceae bacterium]|nr:DNA recombination protein RmuC [Muribaculaceae bacterium]